MTKGRKRTNVVVVILESMTRIQLLNTFYKLGDDRNGDLPYIINHDVGSCLVKHTVRLHKYSEIALSNNLQ